MAKLNRGWGRGCGAVCLSLAGLSTVLPFSLHQSVVALVRSAWGFCVWRFREAGVWPDGEAVLVSSGDIVVNRVLWVRFGSKKKSTHLNKLIFWVGACGG